ncbi:LysM peptidoglycan-binding domain-containing protein [Agromyces mediolanus]|uniref:muramidase family protein n=1 Tax=Agromyces mediolanus TaxID=41986 RepID=UPI003610E28B
MSSIAVALGFAQPADAAPQPPKRQAKGKPAASGAAAVRAVAGAVPVEVTVAEGDTVTGIAERYGLSTAELLAANGLGWSSLIFPGQRLVLPGGAPRASEAAPEIARHTVAAGDTMGGIADRYGIDLDQLLSANGLGRESLIFPGQQVVLPIAGAVPAAAPAASPAAPAEGAAPEQVTVAEGDTAWDLAERLDVDLEQLLAANQLGPDAVLQPGQVLTVPRAATAVALVASVSTVLTEEMRQNAKLVIDIGRPSACPTAGSWSPWPPPPRSRGSATSSSATATPSASSSSAPARAGAPRSRCSTRCARPPPSTAGRRTRTPASHEASWTSPAGSP